MLKKIGLTVLVIMISGFMEAIGAICGILSGAIMFDWMVGQVGYGITTTIIATMAFVVMTILITICVILGSHIILEDFGLTEKDGATA